LADKKNQLVIFLHGEPAKNKYIDKKNHKYDEALSKLIKAMKLTNSDFTLDDYSSFIYSSKQNRGDFTVLHFFSITLIASSGNNPINVLEPFFMISLFSNAICSSLSPRIAVCSKLIDVITQARGFKTFVASSRPPKPVSITA